MSTYARHPVWAERSMAVALQSVANRLASVSKERKNQPNQRPFMLSVERPFRRELDRPPQVDCAVERPLSATRLNSRYWPN